MTLKNKSQRQKMKIEAEETSGLASANNPTVGNNNQSFMSKTRGRLAKLLSIKNSHTSLEEEVAELIDEHDPERKQVGTEERSILYNVLSLSEKSVSDVMIPRADITAVDHHATLDEVKKIIIERKHTRIPIYKKSLDNVIGFIHIKDLIPYLDVSTKKHFSVDRILRKIIFVPPSMKIIDMLLKMQATRLHIALVLDEYGGTDGLVTLEDLLEEIIGEIEDEHDKEENTEIKVLDEATIEVNARMTVAELESRMNIKFNGEGKEDYDTLGGLVVYLLGHVPVKGEKTRHKSGIEFEVLEAEPRKVSKLLIRKVLPE